MANCFYCHAERIVTPSTGDCQHESCGRPVCTPPPPMHRKRAHGDPCKCACEAIICIRHLKDHSAEHGVADCFPVSSTLASSVGLTAALKMSEGESNLDAGPRLVDGDLADDFRDLDILLTFFSPGVVSFERAKKDAPDEARVGLAKIAPSDPPTVSDALPLIPLSRMIALSTHVLGSAWSVLEDEDRHRLEGHLEPWRAESLDRLAGPEPDYDLLVADMTRVVSPGIARGAQEVLASLSVPEDEVELVYWLLDVERHEEGHSTTTR